MNELIRASAGSGKTYQLSSHFLRRLFQGQRPDSILATTFTRKAAGEILGRVLLRLAEAALSEEQAAQLQTALDAGTISRATALKMLADLTRSLHRLYARFFFSAGSTRPDAGARTDARLDHR
jgi:ATP-dependent exoDNAse (exonuclease V) beta subunit